MVISMGIYTFGKTLLNSHYLKINGIQWDHFNGKQWETLPREFIIKLLLTMNGNKYHKNIASDLPLNYF